MSKHPTGSTANASTDEEVFDVSRIIRRMFIATLVIVGIVLGAMILFREELTSVSRLFVDTLGGFGISLGFILPDAFTVPLPNDAFTFFGYMGGIPFWECVLWGSAGSLVGGSIGFLIGRQLQKTRWYAKVMATRGREVAQMVERYATVTLLVAAITPIPYSLACWAVGAAGMRYPWFLFLSLSRIFKVALYLWLIAEGILPSFDAGAPG